MKLAVFVTRPGPRPDRRPRGQGLDQNAALQQRIASLTLRRPRARVLEIAQGLKG